MKGCVKFFKQTHLNEDKNGIVFLIKIQWKINLFLISLICIIKME